jgi:hypothetical protein
MGGTNTIGGVGGRGHQLIAGLLQVPGVRIAALCDVDETFLRREAQPLKDKGLTIATHRDLRRVFDTRPSTPSSSRRRTTGTVWRRCGPARPGGTFTSRSRFPTNCGNAARWSRPRGNMAAWRRPARRTAPAPCCGARSPTCSVANSAVSVLRMR